MAALQVLLCVRCIDARIVKWRSGEETVKLFG